jgi:putative multiple sugar transport system substrate-binding protein
MENGNEPIYKTTSTLGEIGAKSNPEEVTPAENNSDMAKETRPLPRTPKETSAEQTVDNTQPKTVDPSDTVNAYDSKASKGGSRLSRVRWIGVLILLIPVLVVILVGVISGKFDGNKGSVETEPTTALSTVNTGSDAKKIGVAMPTQSLPRWNQVGEYLKKELEAAGYEVDLQYAENDVATQVSQINDMISGGCDVLVITAIDGYSLVDVLETAKGKQIKVIAYDRLLMNTDACDFYVKFDMLSVGTVQGQYIETALDLKNAGGKVYTIEMFAGPPSDSYGLVFFQSAFDVLSPYINAGTLRIVSGLTGFEEIAVENYSTETAQEEMSNRLSKFYSDGTKLDAVLCPNDSIALGITNSLIADGKQAGVDFPVITGQDCDITNLKNIIEGKQSMSIIMDPRDSCDRTVDMVKAIIEEMEVPVNDTTTYDNGVMVVPSFDCSPKIVDKSNYKKLLIDSGYYTEGDLE